MAVQVSRKSLDFVALDYTSNKPQVQILPGSEGSESLYKAWKKDKSFTMRCYMSLQGEDAPPLFATQLYRYDWAFGIALVENFYWDWMGELPVNGALAIQLVLQPDAREGGPEMLPAGAVLSALHPGRNTKGFVEQMLPALLKSGGEIVKIGSAALPPLEYLASGLTFGSNILESSSGNQKNWFLYQFLDEKLQCPVVEWRIYRDVLKEYGPLIRGSLFLSLPQSSPANPGNVRIWLRPQIHYCSGDEICYLIPTDQLKPEDRVYIDVRPAS
jgi:hypothetical protein